MNLLKILLNLKNYTVRKKVNSTIKIKDSMKARYHLNEKKSYQIVEKGICIIDGIKTSGVQVMNDKGWLIWVKCCDFY